MRDIICTDINRRGVISSLCEASLEKYGTNPLLLASEALTDVIMRHKSNIVIVSFGFAVPPAYVQETDGITGAVFLTKALRRLGITTALIIDRREDLIRITKEALKVAGLKPLLVEGSPCSTCLSSTSVPVITLEVANPLIRGNIMEIFNNLPPSAMIFIEKAGHNYLGVYHSMSGTDISRYHAHIEEALNIIRIYDAITLSIGDGGNEVGMGVIEDTIRRVVPYGNICRCPCRGGIAASSNVDYLITSAVSNIGAYALELLLLKSLGKLNYAHAVRDEVLCLEVAVSYGAVDGVTGVPSIMVDGLSREDYEKLLHAMLNVIA